MRSIRVFATTAALAGALALGMPLVASASTPPSNYFTVITGPSFEINGAYSTVVGSFTTPGLDDIIWYSQSARDSQWTPCPDCESGPFTKRSLSPQFDAEWFTPIVGDFAGDELDDILWYASEKGTSRLWTSHAGGAFTTQNVSISQTYQPVVLHTSKPGDKDSILWVVAPPHTSPVWSFPADGSGTPHTVGRAPVPGWDTCGTGCGRAAMEPLVGDFDGDGLDDIEWHTYNAGSYWHRTCATCGTWTTRTQVFRHSYDAVVGQFAGRSDGPDDILWLGDEPSNCTRGGCSYAGPDLLWKGSSDSQFVSSYPNILSAFGLRLRRPEGDVAMFPTYGELTSIWTGRPSGSHEVPIADHALWEFTTLVGRFTTPGYDDIVDYEVGHTPDRLFAAIP